MGDDPMRTAIGNTTIDENDNIGALLGQQQTQIEKNTENREEIPAAVGKTEKGKMGKQEVNTGDEKLKHNRSAKFTDLEVEQLEKIMLAIGTDKVSKALRWCLSKAWEVNGDEVERIAEEKKKIGIL
jgi:hypothetical protein